MSPAWILLTYGGAALLAWLVLMFARARRWYWHASSVVLALAIGLVPLPAQLNTPQWSLIIGFAFLFLFLWGVGAPFFRRRST